MKKRNRIKLIFLLLGLTNSYIQAQDSDRNSVVSEEREPHTTPETSTRAVQSTDIEESITSLVNHPSSSVAIPQVKNGYAIDYYHGIPNVSVPLYEIATPYYPIPILLNYNITNVKPNIHPGIVGLGWSFSALGSITRNTKGTIDDRSNRMRKMPSRLNSNLWGLNFTSTGEGFIDLCHSAYFESPKIDDSELDEFFFEFLNFSGYFILDGLGEWQVISDYDFKVECEVKPIKEVSRNPLKGAEGNSIWSFRLTDPSGIVYVFGGENETEYSVEYFRQSYRRPVAMKWYLKEIIMPNNQTVKYYYHIQAPYYEVSPGFQVTQIEATNLYSFNLTLPVRLDSMEFCGTKISFSYEKSIEKAIRSIYFSDRPTKEGHFSIIDLTKNDYELKDLQLTDGRNEIIHFEYFSDFSKLERIRLSSIHINNELSYQLNYTSKTYERSKLISVEKYFDTSKPVEKYSFGYNQQLLPDYASGYYDRLGYYNGMQDDYFESHDFLNSSYRSSDEMRALAEKFDRIRQGDTTGRYACAELLESVTYPTGGSMTFTYEPNIVSKMVDFDRTGLKDSTFYPGGVRIKEINAFSEYGKPAYTKKYYYCKDYSHKSNKQMSSGILSFTPVKLWNLKSFDITSVHYKMGYESLTRRQYMSSFSPNSTWSDKNGYFISYTDVIEETINSEGKSEGYTKLKYGTYEDVCFDAPMMLIVQQISPFNPMTNYGALRGNLILTEVYDADHILKLKRENVYGIFPRVANAEIRNESFYYLPEKLFDGPVYVFGGRHMISPYTAKLYRQTITNYENTIPISTITDYSYNSNKLLAWERKIYSSEECYETFYTYSGDIAESIASTASGDLQIFKDMKAKNILDLPVEKRILKNSKVISADIYTYKKHREFICPYQEFKLESTAPLTYFYDYQKFGIISEGFIFDSRCKLQKTYEVFTDYNNPVSVIDRTKKEVNYLWAYQGNYPIAEIRNADLASIRNALLYQNTSVEALLNNSNSEYLLQVCNQLREALPEAQITSYTYKNNVGVTSITQPNSVVKYFNYTPDGKLTESYTLENGQKRIIEYYNYNISQ